MELPLIPLDFARRARKLYGDREAVVGGGLRLTYTEFLERCDHWPAALQDLGVRRGDRVAIISPNAHAMCGPSLLPAAGMSVCARSMQSLHTGDPVCDRTAERR
jgi:acyl-CoA synthetase (AMP-forming)/AMP-acid ligase II